MSITIRLPAKRSKYGNRKTEYRGVMYDSAAEARYAAQLDLRVKAGELLGWERQKRKPIIVAGKKICDVVVDFLVMSRGSSGVEYHEVKGFEKEAWKLKRKLFEAVYGPMIVINSKDVR